MQKERVSAKAATGTKGPAEACAGMRFYTSRQRKNLQDARIQIPNNQPLIAIQNRPERFLKKSPHQGRIVYIRIFAALIPSNVPQENKRPEPQV